MSDITVNVLEDHELLEALSVGAKVTLEITGTVTAIAATDLVWNGPDAPSLITDKRSVTIEVHQVRRA